MSPPIQSKANLGKRASIASVDKESRKRSNVVEGAVSADGMLDHKYNEENVLEVIQKQQESSKTKTQKIGSTPRKTIATPKKNVSPSKKKVSPVRKSPRLEGKEPENLDTMDLQ